MATETASGASKDWLPHLAQWDRKTMGKSIWWSLVFRVSTESSIQTLDGWKILAPLWIRIPYVNELVTRCEGGLT